jgi:hypothetical protein
VTATEPPAGIAGHEESGAMSPLRGAAASKSMPPALYGAAVVLWSVVVLVALGANAQGTQIFLASEHHGVTAVFVAASLLLGPLLLIWISLLFIRSPARQPIAVVMALSLASFAVTSLAPLADKYWQQVLYEPRLNVGALVALTALGRVASLGLLLVFFRFPGGAFAPRWARWAFWLAVRILVEGMVLGTFTGRKLADYFHCEVADWRRARRIINGRDKAALIAGHAKAFYGALSYTV